MRQVPKTKLKISKCGTIIFDPSVCFEPYISIHVSKDPSVRYLKYKDEYVHRLVAKAWCWNRNPPKLWQVDHIDGDSQNNHAHNLRWLTKQCNNMNKKRKSYARKRFLPGRRGCFWESRVQYNKVVYKKFHKNKEEAEAQTKRMINEFFFKAYYEIPTKKTPRPPGMHYWREGEHGTFIRPHFSDIGV